MFWSSEIPECGRHWFRHPTLTGNMPQIVSVRPASPSRTAADSQRASRVFFEDGQQPVDLDDVRDGRWCPLTPPRDVPDWLDDLFDRLAAVPQGSWERNFFFQKLISCGNVHICYSEDCVADFIASTPDDIRRLLALLGIRFLPAEEKISAEKIQFTDGEIEVMLRLSREEPFNPDIADDLWRNGWLRTTGAPYFDGENMRVGYDLSRAGRRALADALISKKESHMFWSSEIPECGRHWFRHPTLTGDTPQIVSVRRRRVFFEDGRPPVDIEDIRDGRWCPLTPPRDVPDWLDDIFDRLAAVPQGSWERNDLFRESINAGNVHICGSEDCAAHFIASAPDDIRRLLALLGIRFPVLPAQEQQKFERNPTGRKWLFTGLIRNNRPSEAGKTVQTGENPRFTDEEIEVMLRVSREEPFNPDIAENLLQRGWLITNGSPYFDGESLCLRYDLSRAGRRALADALIRRAVKPLPSGGGCQPACR